MMQVHFDEYDSGGAHLGVMSPVVNTRMLNSQTGTWEEAIYFYTPSSSAVASVRPKLSRKSGPAAGRNVLFADDFAFWELDEGGARSFRAPPGTNTPFDGARTRIEGSAVPGSGCLQTCCVASG